MASSALLTRSRTARLIFARPAVVFVFVEIIDHFGFVLPKTGNSTID